MFRLRTLTKLRKLNSKRLSSKANLDSRNSNARKGKGARRMEDVDVTSRKLQQGADDEANELDQRTREESSHKYVPERKWESTRFENDLQKKGMDPRRRPEDHTIFTVVSYNILAQDLLESHLDLYTGIRREHLEWGHRKRCLLREIRSLQPDILCLQEIQTSHLEGFTDELQERFTYGRIFKKRTGSEKTDGCAIFYNTDMFQLISSRTIEFNQGINLLDRDNIGVVVKLRSRANPSSVFIVATTHLLFNPKRMDIRLAQVHVLLAELEQMAFDTNKGRYYPIILTGDFNTTPDSVPYNLIADGRISYQQMPQKSPQKHPIITDDLGITNYCQHIHSIKYGRDCTESQLYHSERQDRNPRREKSISAGYECLFNTGFLTHPLNLTSVMRQNSQQGSAGAFASTHHDEWINVDFLFYSRYFNQKFNRIIEGDLKLLSKLALPRIIDCERMGKLPNQTLGSDHFSLAAKFLLRSPKFMDQ